jgi:hypothetical protein
MRRQRAVQLAQLGGQLALLAGQAGQVSLDGQQGGIGGGEVSGSAARAGEAGVAGLGAAGRVRWLPGGLAQHRGHPPSLVRHEEQAGPGLGNLCARGGGCQLFLGDLDVRLARPL